MSRLFPLAGLLRLRQLQEDQAAGTLAQARQRAAQHTNLEKEARSELDGTSSEVSGAASLLAVAAARSASRSMLAGLQVLSDEHRTAVEEARKEYAVAKLRATGLEKLQGRHDRQVTEDDQRAEQRMLDELALTAHGRTPAGVFQ